MFWQLCVALFEAEGEGVAELADAALTAVVPVVREVVDVFADDVVVAEWLVAALAAARLPPNPTPSAPAPTAVPIMILPSLDLNVSASSRSGDGPGHRTPALAATALRRDSVGAMRRGQRAGRVTVKTSWLAWVASEPMPVTASPDGASALIW
jgi:hypothetical protein